MSFLFHHPEFTVSYCWPHNDSEQQLLSLYLLILFRRTVLASSAPHSRFLWPRITFSLLMAHFVAMLYCRRSLRFWNRRSSVRVQLWRRGGSHCFQSSSLFLSFFSVSCLALGRKHLCMMPSVRQGAGSCFVCDKQVGLQYLQGNTLSARNWIKNILLYYLIIVDNSS